MPTKQAIAISRKRKYSAIDLLISDNLLSKNVARYETGAAMPLLTLGTALLRDDTAPSGMVVQSLDENLAHLSGGLSKTEHKKLASNLLNAQDQFLNTVSELGLGRYYSNNGWRVELARPLPIGKKDVDLYLENTQGNSRWLDVVNAAPDGWDLQGFAPFLPQDFEMRLVDKVVDKFEDKFREVLDGGWRGDPWVALDIIKHSTVSVAVTMLGLIGNTKIDDFAKIVLSRCPEMKGFAYYTHYATETTIQWIKEYCR